MAPRDAIDGPLTEAGRRGLLAAAVPASFVRGLDWRNGFSFSADTCDVIDPMPVECVADPSEKSLPENVDAVDYDPFVVFGVDKCSTMAGSARDRSGRALRNLLATESFQAESEFFDGVASAQASNPVNPFLTDGTMATDATGAGVVNAIRSLALLEGALAGCLHGQRGMIHATPELVSLWDAGGGLRVVGDLILTVHDTIVVAGSGYSGNSPAGNAPGAGTSWAYGTGLVYKVQEAVWEESTATNPGADPVVALAPKVDRVRNDEIWRYERLTAVFVSPCCVLAVHASLT